MPDIWVRPGGVPFGAAYGTAPMSADDAVVEPEGLRLDVEPLLAAVPIGAPVRVRTRCTTRRTMIPAPSSSLAESSIESTVWLRH